MGKHLQLGICNQIIIRKDRMEKASIDQINIELANRLDMDLFDFEERNEYLIFTIKENVLEEQLSKFLVEQFNLYDEKYEREFSLILTEIAKRQTSAEIVKLATDKEFLFFQQNNIHDFVDISPWQSADVDISLLVIFFEGKLLMESYNSYLHYLEKLVRASSQQSIAGAFRAFID
ncbi:hypothetical protein M3231_24985 [Neobacillus mesonae]|nr:hypothetical protein [Neobacillus mesonae]